MTKEQIEIYGACEHNLQNVDVCIPKEKLIILAGVSGSGKSSLAFDTVAVESARQWQSSYPMYLRNRLPSYARPKVERMANLTPCIVVDQSPMGANVRSTVGTATDIAPLVRLLFSRIAVPSAGGSMAYSANHPHGMCPDCTGLGQQLRLDETKMFDQEKTIDQGAIRFTPFFGGGWQEFYFRHNPLFPADVPLKDFTAQQWHDLRIGPDTPLVMDYIRNNTGQVSKLPYEGVVTRFNRLYLNRDISGLKKSIQDEAKGFMQTSPCPTCGGSGLHPMALQSRIGEHNIYDYYAMEIPDLLAVLEQITHPFGVAIAKQISAGLQRMVDVGLDYLTLSRRTDTLSGGEAQRLKMVRHLGSSLSNITYIFDEPTAGLHLADAKRIGKLLLELRDLHNTVLVVEHSPYMMSLADHIIELGPLAGRHGGQVVYEGTLDALHQGDTATAKALQTPVVLNQHPLPWTDCYPIRNASLHNLKQVNIDIPKGVLTVVSGVAGSGKSSLICGVFAPAYPQAVVVSQRAIGTSSRSTIATYTGVMDDIRKIFAKENGVSHQWFSFNSKGACPVCKGKGEIIPDVAFADGVAIVCEECGGVRYNQEALSYTYQEKNIQQVLSLTVNQALDFFPQPNIQKPLQLLQRVGLGYVSLGQPTSTLSGGEVQRLKLASELGTQGQIYILDEPTTGLHHADVCVLLELLRHLVSLGNTVVVVEHRMEVIAGADWVIDMGPSGGKQGGEILFAGTPVALLTCESSRTADALQWSFNVK